MGNAQDAGEQPRGFFPWAVRAVSEPQPGAPKPPFGVAEPISQPGWPRRVDADSGSSALQGARSRRSVLR